MFHAQAGARLRALSLLATTAGVLVSGCIKALPDQSGAKLTISATQPSGTYQPGDDIAFRVTVTNAGAGDVTLLSIDTMLDAKVNERSITCTGLGLSAANAGPATCDDFIYMQRLAAGTSVTLDIVATVFAASQGTITNSFTASVISGPAAVTASNGAAIVDMRSGTYQAFASNGQAYSLAADFTAGSATFSGAGADVVRPFAAPSSTSGYDAFAAGLGLQAHHDLLVGTVDLGGGPTPFIAGRTFVTTIAALDGRSFNTFDIDTPASGAATSRFLSTTFSGTTMLVCADALPHTAAACPADSLQHYDLSVADGVFTGVDAAHGDTATFRVAQSVNQMILLRAQATSTGRLFQAGLSTTNSGITDTRFHGGDTLGRWGGLLLTPPNLSESFPQAGVATSSIQGTLFSITGAPAGLAASFLGDTSATVYLAQDNGLEIVMGMPGGPLDGLLQLFDY